MKSTAKTTITLAETHVERGTMASSATVALADARVCYARGDYNSAHRRALRSLEYSVGRFSDIYREVNNV